MQHFTARTLVLLLAVACLAAESDINSASLNTKKEESSEEIIARIKKVARQLINVEIDIDRKPPREDWYLSPLNMEDAILTYCQNDITTGSNNIRRLSLQCLVTPESEPHATCYPGQLPVCIKTYIDKSTGKRFFKGVWHDERYLSTLTLSDLTTLWCEHLTDPNSCSIKYSVISNSPTFITLERVFRGGIQTIGMLNDERLTLSAEEVRGQLINLRQFEIHYFNQGTLRRKQHKDWRIRPQIIYIEGLSPSVVKFENPQGLDDPLLWTWYVKYDEYVQLLTGPKDRLQLIPHLECDTNEDGLFHTDTCSVILSWHVLLPKAEEQVDLIWSSINRGNDNFQDNAEYNCKAQPDDSPQKEELTLLERCRELLTTLSLELQDQSKRVVNYMRAQSPAVLMIILTTLQFVIIGMLLKCQHVSTTNRSPSLQLSSDIKTKDKDRSTPVKPPRSRPRSVSMVEELNRTTSSEQHSPPSILRGRRKQTPHDDVSHSRQSRIDKLHPSVQAYLREEDVTSPTPFGQATAMDGESAAFPGTDDQDKLY